MNIKRWVLREGSSMTSLLDGEVTEQNEWISLGDHERYVQSLQAERDEALSDCDLMRAICERRTAERDGLREALEMIAALGATDGLNAKVIARRALEGGTTTTPEWMEG